LPHAPLAGRLEELPAIAGRRHPLSGWKKGRSGRRHPLSGWKKGRSTAQHFDVGLGRKVESNPHRLFAVAFTI